MGINLWGAVLARPGQDSCGGRWRGGGLWSVHRILGGQEPRRKHQRRMLPTQTQLSQIHQVHILLRHTGGRVQGPKNAGIRQIEATKNGFFISFLSLSIFFVLFAVAVCAAKPTREPLGVVAGKEYTEPIHRRPPARCDEHRARGPAVVGAPAQLI